jgi:CBS domain containing-hemolysin-like protein
VDLVILLVLLGLSAAFSGSETAFFSLGEAELARLEAGKGRGGRRVAALLQRSHDLLSALLVGNLLVNTAASVVATGLCMRWFGGGGLAVAVAVPMVTLALLIFGEITPKMLALRYRLPVALAAQWPLSAWLAINAPLLRVLRLLLDGLLRRLPMERTGTRPLTPDELEAACDLSVTEGTLSETEGRALARLLRLEDLAVARIMTPRTEVVALRRGDTLPQVLDTARRAGFNRYPVLPREGDRPEGLFHLKDLLAAGAAPEEDPLAGSLRPLGFVPESKNVASLLTEMRQGAGHLVAVVDEHGDFTGIVTLADCLQALMGQTADTAYHDSEIIPLGDGRWVLHGRTGPRELEEACGLRLPAGDYATVAGFLMERLGRVLTAGDRVTLADARLTVLEVTHHRVDRIQVTLRRDAEVAS